MTEEQAAMTPDERIAQDLCAECAHPLKEIDATNHTAQHWPPFMQPAGVNQEAIRRQGLMNQYSEGQLEKRRAELKKKADSAKETPATTKPAGVTSPSRSESSH